MYVCLCMCVCACGVEQKPHRRPAAKSASARLFLPSLPASVCDSNSHMDWLTSRITCRCGFCLHVEWIRMDCWSQPQEHQQEQLHLEIMSHMYFCNHCDSRVILRQSWTPFPTTGIRNNKVETDAMLALARLTSVLVLSAMLSIGHAAPQSLSLRASNHDRRLWSFGQQMSTSGAVVSVGTGI
jgi:hypothetical protein